MKNGILLLTLIFLSTGCLLAQQADKADSLNRFSVELYKQLKSDKENLFFSPVSIDMALLMAREGAQTATKAEFDKVLHIDSNKDNQDAPDFILKLKDFKDSSNQLNISNAIWISQDYKINIDFQNRIQTGYLADAFLVNFSDPNKSAIQMNKWAALKTHDLIHQVISPDQINQSTKLVLTNSFCFIGKWAKKFDTYLTKKDDFYGINLDTAKIDFMHETGLMDYFENNNFQFIARYYKGFDKSFCIILPKERYGISTIETMMDKSILDSIFNHVVLKDVDLSIPKFKLETSYSLNESLIKLGLKEAFTDDADFSGISAQLRLKISYVSQQAYIDVNEVKTEASAVTKIMNEFIGSTGIPKLKPTVFKADHPFLFMIIDTQTKGIIFMGRYVKRQ